MSISWKRLDETHPGRTTINVCALIHALSFNAFRQTPILPIYQLKSMLRVLEKPVSLRRIFLLDETVLSSTHNKSYCFSLHSKFLFICTFFFYRGDITLRIGDGWTRDTSNEHHNTHLNNSMKKGTYSVNVLVFLNSCRYHYSWSLDWKSSRDKWFLWLIQYRSQNIYCSHHGERLDETHPVSTTMNAFEQTCFRTLWIGCALLLLLYQKRLYIIL